MQLDERIDLCIPQIDPTLGESGVPPRRVIPPPPTLWARVEVSVGCPFRALPALGAGTLLRLQPPGMPAQVVCSVHSGAYAAKVRERTDLCTMGSSLWYVGDLGLWWGSRLRS